MALKKLINFFKKKLIKVSHTNNNALLMCIHIFLHFYSSFSLSLLSHNYEMTEIYVYECKVIIIIFLFRLHIPIISLFLSFFFIFNVFYSQWHSIMIFFSLHPSKNDPLSSCVEQWMRGQQILHTVKDLHSLIFFSWTIENDDSETL